MRRLRIWIVVGVLFGLTVIAPGDAAADAAPSNAAADTAASDSAADAAPSDAGQSLADVARAEEARRKATPKAAKVYTNNDLQPDSRSRQTQPAGPAGAPTQPSASGPPAGPSSGAAPSAPAPTADPSESASSAAKDEKYWRTRITQARERLQRSRLFLEALQSRINALSTDFVNRDDPAQRTVIANDRDTALAELDRVKKEIDDLTKAIADIEEEARRAGVPPGWLR